jgi:hypothetical protein
MARMNDLIVNEQPEVDMERAKRAVQRFRSMLPGLNGYVRAISGSKTLHIELSAGQPRTDGRKIYMEPPIELGDDLTHERIICDKRDPVTAKQLCYGCAVREDLLIKIYHEIAHNIYGTFEMQVSGRALKAKIYNEINNLEPTRAKQIQDKLWVLNPAPSSYLELAGHVNPFLPTLVNALEDLRVDEAMFKARKGTRAMFYAMTRATFVDGIRRLDGSLVEWRDMPLNHQAIVGIFVLGCKYNFDGWFHPAVDAALRDAKIVELVNDVDELESSLETFERAFPILERLRELGFCLTEEEYDQKEQDSGESGEQSEQEPDNESSEEGGDSSPDRGSESSVQAPDQASDDEASPEQGESESSPESNGESGLDGDDLEGSAAEQEQDASREVSAGRGDEADDDALAGEGSEGSESDSDSSDGSEDHRPELGDEDEPGSGRGEAENSEEDSEGPTGGDSGAGDSSEESEAESKQDLDELSEDDSPIDSGADEGLGGIPLKDLYGNADGLEDVVDSITKHGDYQQSSAGGESVSQRTITQSIYFEKESGTVSSVKEHFLGDGCSEDAWTRAEGSSARARRRRGADVGDLTVGEDILGPTLLKMRTVFADNARAAQETNLRSGRVNARVLGRRVKFHDPRLFQKKRMPGKRSYAVLIGVDISGSTIGLNIALAKLAAWAQAELCNRLGIEFAVYAHSATPQGGTHCLDMYCIKDFDSPWDTKAEKALLSIGSWSENLDGHSLEYYRKRIENRRATDKIILYYTDGKMPAANYSEELTILQREIDTCRRKRITLLGVGIRTDSPRRHGLDTVQVDGPEDTIKVVQHLESCILHNR